MGTNTVYGLGGFDPTKPDNNVIEVIEVADDPIVETTVSPDAEALAEALTSLPPETLDALKQALGLQ